MGTNFHTAWDTAIIFKPASMNPALASLDKGITYLKNIIVHCDGEITYNKATGVLTWSDVLRIHFNREDGQAIQNTVAAGNITPADNEFVYLDLNETNNTALTAQKAAITTGAASNFKAVNRIVLGYRNTASDEFYPVYLENVKEAVVTVASAANVTIDWSKGHVQQITLDQNASVTFSGGHDGDKLILRVKQDATGTRVPTWPGTVRYGTDITGITLTTTANKTDYIGFVYNSADSKYDCVWIVRGY